MKKKAKKVEVRMHQHQDGRGNVFGKSHPLRAYHENKATQCDHDITLIQAELLTLKKGKR